MAHRVVTFVEQLLADENDTGVAETLSLPGQRFGHLLFAVFDEGDGIAFDAQTKSMPPANQQPNGETLNSKVRGRVLTFRRSSGRRNRLAAADVWCLLPRPRDNGATLFCRRKRPAAHRQRRCTRRKERN
jgi:hypothetical protein